MKATKGNTANKIEKARQILEKVYTNIDNSNIYGYEPNEKMRFEMLMLTTDLLLMSNAITYNWEYKTPRI